MSLFGQVWLYSLAAFALGVLFTWLLLVRPTRTRVRELERRIVAHRSEFVSESPESTRQADRTSAETDTDMAFAELDLVLPTSEGAESTEPSVYDEEPADWRDHSPGVVPGDAHSEWFTPTGSGADAAPDRDRDVTTATGAGTDIGAALAPDAVPEPEEHSARGPFQATSAGSSPQDPWAAGMFHGADAASADEAVGEEPTRHVAAVTDADRPGAGALPKRQRKDSPPGGFDPPEPVQPSMRAVARREPTPPGRQSGSLFEPDVPAASSGGVGGVGDVQAPTGTGAAGGHTAGPFGHGSAMPLPGGGRPSEEFTIKASATMLRYCSPDSASFPEMVAEVWFRTPQDAEQVGFRPVD